MIDPFAHDGLFGLSFKLEHLYMKAWVLTLVVGIAMWARLKPVQRRLLVFVGFSIIMEYISTLPGTIFLWHPTSNSPWYYLLTPPLFYLYVRIAGPILFEQRWAKWRWVFGIGIVVLTAMNAVWGDGFYRFPSMIVGLYSMVGILFALGYLFHLLSTMSVILLEREPLFWISAGFLIYFSGNLLTWLSFNFVTYERGFYRTVININFALTILLNILLIISVCVRRARSNTRATIRGNLASL